MKSAKQITDGKRTYTLITCGSCGRQSTLQGHITTKACERALQRKCKTCHPPRKQLIGTSWWHAFGLRKNPYVYGPMPYKRTGERWRLVEARQRGWLAWYWVDEYTDERLGATK